MPLKALFLFVLLAANCHAAVEVNQAAQQNVGIRTELLTPCRYQMEIRAYGTVRLPQDLVDSRSRYIAAMTQWEAAEAMNSASQREYERLKVLHLENQSISDKAFEAGEATWKGDRARAFAAETSLESQRQTTRAEWGEVIARWIFDDLPDFVELVHQRIRLIEVHVPLGERLPTPLPEARLQTRDGGWIEAQFISLAPFTDSLTQGLTLFYLAREVPDQLLPGGNVLFGLPVDIPSLGFLISQGAVVWSEGKAWVYTQQSSTSFARIEISTRFPTPDGWFVIENLSEGDYLVVSGAQLLLSQEESQKISIAKRD